MSLQHILSSHVTPGTLAVTCHSWSTCRRISIFQRRIAVSKSCHSWSSCQVMSILELLASRDTPGAPAGNSLISSGILFSPSRDIPGALAQSCHSWNSCPVMSLLELSPSRVTHGDLAQSLHFLSSPPVVSLLPLLPSRVTPAGSACESLSTSGVLLSPRLVTPGSLAQLSYS